MTNPDIHFCLDCRKIGRHVSLSISSDLVCYDDKQFHRNRKRREKKKDDSINKLDWPSASSLLLVYSLLWCAMMRCWTLVGRLLIKVAMGQPVATWIACALAVHVASLSRPSQSGGEIYFQQSDYSSLHPSRAHVSQPPMSNSTTNSPTLSNRRWVARGEKENNPISFAYQCDWPSLRDRSTTTTPQSSRYSREEPSRTVSNRPIGEQDERWRVNEFAEMSTRCHGHIVVWFFFLRHRLPENEKWGFALSETEVFNHSALLETHWKMTTEWPHPPYPLITLMS